MGVKQFKLRSTSYYLPTSSKLFEAFNKIFLHTLPACTFVAKKLSIKKKIKAQMYAGKACV
jgi:hypothetical protein